MAIYRMEIWGEMCPIPLLKAEKKLKDLTKGEILVMITDHSCTAQTVENWAKKHKYPVEIEEVDNGVWEIAITKY